MGFVGVVVLPRSWPHNPHWDPDFSGPDGNFCPRPRRTLLYRSGCCGSVRTNHSGDIRSGEPALCKGQSQSVFQWIDLTSALGFCASIHEGWIVITARALAANLPDLPYVCALAAASSVISFD